MFLWHSAQEFPLNAHADVFSGAKGLNFGMSLHLYPYFGYASIEGSGEVAHLRRFACAFVARKGGKYQHLMTLLIFLDTVNSEMFVAIIQNVKPSRNGEITQSLTDIGKVMP